MNFSSMSRHTVESSRGGNNLARRHGGNLSDSQEFHYFQPSENALGPHTTVWLHVPEVPQVTSGRHDHGPPGHPQDFSLPLRLPGTAAGPTHGVPALLQRAACIPTSWGWSVWPGEAGAPAWGG